MSINAEDISYTIQGRRILSGISIVCNPGEMIALTGPSGSGKTTLLGLLGLLLTPTTGTIKIGHSKKWNSTKRRLFWKQHAAFVYQDYGLIDEETVHYNITLRRKNILSKPSSEEQKRFESVLEKVGMAGRENDKAAILSGGEKQRIGMARALWKKADYIFVDEPTASLDAANREKISLLLQEASKNGACVIISTHDENLARLCTKRIDLALQEAEPESENGTDSTNA